MITLYDELIAEYDKVKLSNERLKTLERDILKFSDAYNLGFRITCSYGEYRVFRQISETETSTVLSYSLNSSLKLTSDITCFNGYDLLNHFGAAKIAIAKRIIEYCRNYKLLPE